MKKVAAEQGVTLGADVTIINPADVRKNYVARLVELRKSKGLTEEQARAQLEDTVVLGTMMLEAGKDGWSSFWCRSYNGKHYSPTDADHQNSTWQFNYLICILYVITRPSISVW